MTEEFQGQRFCENCNNLLYADEEFNSVTDRCLVFNCKLCNHSQRVPDANERDNCVYKTDLEAKAERLVINEDIVDDPTLAKRQIDKCPNKNKNCTSNQVIIFYHITFNKMELIYVCIKCRHWWRMQERDNNYDIADDTETDEEIGM